MSLYEKIRDGKKLYSSVFYTLLKILVRLDLAIQDGRGQCYDGDATMSAKKAGIATLFKLLNPKMLYTNRYRHALNLAVKDACFKVTILKEAFKISREVIKLVKISPQRDTKLKAIRSEKINTGKSVHAFCPTRWTVRGETLNAILNSFDELRELWYVWVFCWK